MNAWDAMKQGIEKWRKRNTSPYERLSCPVSPTVTLQDVVVPQVHSHAGIVRVRELMSSGHWYTLSGLAHHTGLSEGTAQRYMRELRSVEHGGHTINKRLILHSTVWEYSLVINQQMECV